MPSWWRKSSNKLKKKSSGESIIDWQCIRPGASRKRHSTGKKESQSGEESRSSSLSEKVSCNVGFSEKPQPQPLPLPQCTESSMCRSSKNSLFKPPSKPGQGKIRKCAAEGEIDFISNSSDSSSDTDDPSDSRILSPQASDYENGLQSAVASPWAKQVDQFPIAIKKNSIQMLMPKTISSVPASPALRPSKSHISNLQIPYRGVLSSAPDSSMSSPSRSPIQFSGQCSSPGSGQNSVAGDISSQFLWPHSRNSPECSPLPSPRMTSPGPSSRIQSGATTPLHPGIGVQSTGSPRLRPDDRNKTSHRLPLPPVTIPRTPSLMGSSPGIPRSPGMAENPPSPGSPWKKGRLLGRGTFGHVYIGFNSETGEMCAMKEVALFSDDSKSKDCTQQLGQEVAMLSKLRHPNIVQYYGSATFGDKLYIYLEYVSGGSIHKILQDYGQLGEAAIRSYTQQILSGLAYLHAKNTLHRDIKGANILVDPNGRVKLADFGMAKHITGQSCPLSLKGSPYWMAPEVIQNTGSCNLAVDIWSLGCTVLEMATTKPPWSQYEGIAAMFKVGNSKELPAIPDNLSDEGKDFVMQCLQRDPYKRPTAAQLMEHPFVRNAATLERYVPSFKPFAKSAVSQSMRVLDIGRSRTPLILDSPGTVNHSKSPKRAPGFSNAYKARNTSCPVSPIGSPLLHPRSPQMHLNGQFCHSPMLSPRPASGSSTPPAYGSLTPPLYIQPTSYFQESGPMTSRFQKNLNLNPKPDIYGEVAHNVEPALLEVSQQLMRNPLRFHHTEFDLNPNCPTPKRNNA